MARRRKAHAEEGHASSERWLLTYADLITLLMVFFVVLYSLGKADVAKFARLQASIQRAFNVQVLRGNDPVSLRGDDGSLTPTSIIQEAIAQRNDGTNLSLVTTLDDLQRVMAALPRSERTREGTRIGMARDGLVISLSGNVLFDSGRADLRADSLTLLDALAERLRILPNEVRVEGHTDDIPIATPLYPTNWELSSARATTVARYLAERGFEPNRLIAAGYGEYRPVVPNDTREGRARNRRVDIVVLSAPAGPPPVTGAAPERVGPPPGAGALLSLEQRSLP